MLKKFQADLATDDPFHVGLPVFIVTKDGEISEGYRIVQRLCDLILLDRSPLDESEKQGFVIEGNLLKPTWCAGRKAIYAVVATRAHAADLAAQRQSLRGM